MTKETLRQAKEMIEQMRQRNDRMLDRIIKDYGPDHPQVAGLKRIQCERELRLDGPVPHN